MQSSDFLRFNAFLSLDERWQKYGKKSLIFDLRHGPKNREKLPPNIVFFGILSCQNAANTSVFRRFALRAGSNKSEENTGIYDTF